jgi:thymidylate synthase
MNIILAHDLQYGIGYQGEIPWDNKTDLNFFKEQTNNCTLIMGRKTVENLPELKNRTVFCVSKNFIHRKYRTFTSVEDAYKEATLIGNPIYIAGGYEIYKYVFENMKFLIKDVYITLIKKIYDSDVLIPELEYFKWTKNLVLEKTLHEDEECVICLYNRKNIEEHKYLNILKNVLKKGHEREGRNGITKSMFCKDLKFDLRSGFPLLTTKKMFLKGIFEEFIFFIRGETDTKILEEKNIYIWNKNTNREFLDNMNMTERTEGLMGPMYGYQWRNFNAPYNEKNGTAITKGIDQLENIVNDIKKDPYSRRLVITDFNPLQASQGVLYPCHSLIIQFYVQDNYLDMYCYNRSQDLFLGTPFNIASSALLLKCIAQICDKIPRYLNIGMGDVHIYKEHYENVKIQISRNPFSFPELHINKQLNTIQDLENLKFEDIKVINYKCQDPIKAEMIA